MRVDWIGAALGLTSIVLAVAIGVAELSGSWSVLALVLAVLTVAQLTS